MARVASGGGVLPGELGLAVDREGPGWVRLEVRLAALTVEDVVRGGVDHRRAHIRCGGRDLAGGASVDPKRLVAGRLGAVDVRVRGAVDHHVGPLPAHDRAHRRAVGDVEVRVGERDHLVVHVLGGANEVLAEHAARAGDDDLHTVRDIKRSAARATPTSPYSRAISALSPTTNRYARGRAGLRAIATLRPIRLASIRLSRSRNEEPESTIEYSSSARSIVTSSPIALYGPM